MKTPDISTIHETVLHGDMHLWTLWNGMVAYILMGTLMAVEWVVRQWVIKKIEAQ